MVVVIGPGRSGTSLVMQLLAAQGMIVDGQRAKLDPSNPLGDYENQEIAAIHEEIFSTLGISPLLPRDISRTEFVKITTQVERLKQIVSDNALIKNKVWGFKDPRTSSLLPMWEIIFRELDLQAKYILCVRNPAAVITSMKEHFSRGEAVSELLWLTRICETIINCGDNLFLIHYEDWFAGQDKAKKLVNDMLNFASLSVAGVDKALEELVKPNLNRSTSTFIPANPDVVKLYQALEILPSGAPLTDSVIKMARECKATAGFYTEVAAQASAKAARKLKLQAEEGSRHLVERISAMEIEAKERETAITELELRLARQVKQRKLLEEEVAGLVANGSSLQLSLAEQSRQIEQDAKRRGVLELRIEELTHDIRTLTETHRKTALNFKAACDENDKLRIQIKTSKEMLASVQRPKAAEKKIGPAKAIQRKAEPPPLSHMQRKMRKLVRTPGLFFKDWLTAIKKKLDV